MKINLLVGIGFFTTLSSVFYFTAIASVDKSKKYPYKMKLYYTRSDGLKVGADVTLQGQDFGYVKETNLISPSEAPQGFSSLEGRNQIIEVVLAVKEPVNLWDNYEIKFKSKTLFSSRTLDIHPGSGDTEEIGLRKPVYGENRREPDFTVPVSYYDDFFAGANALLTENREDLRSCIVHLHGITSKLRGTKGTIPKLINTEEMYNDILETSTDALVLATEARRTGEMSRESNTIPIPFTINLYRRSTTIGKLSDRVYTVSTSQTKTLKPYQ